MGGSLCGCLGKGRSYGYRGGYIELSRNSGGIYRLAYTVYTTLPSLVEVEAEGQVEVEVEEYRHH